MTLVAIPYKPLPSEVRNITQITANFEAFMKVINGELEGINNIAAKGIKTANIENLAIVNALIAKETITEEKLSAALQAKLAEKGTGLVLTNSYSTKEVETTPGTGKYETEPSSTRAAFVVVTRVTLEAEAIIVYCGGVKMGGVSKGNLGSASFWCNPGEKVMIESLPGLKIKCIVAIQLK